MTPAGSVASAYLPDEIGHAHAAALIRGSEQVAFASRDQAQRAAATALGFAIVDPAA
ncbi:MAG: hypothetical protein M3024_12800 [Candidatus Dormibacteraeota bacterium]|nr:hypothetical protein [Candidatus Dormibacteraeota bacterium]